MSERRREGAVSLRQDDSVRHWPGPPATTDGRIRTALAVQGWTCDRTAGGMAGSGFLAERLDSADGPECPIRSVRYIGGISLLPRGFCRYGATASIRPRDEKPEGGIAVEEPADRGDDMTPSAGQFLIRLREWAQSIDNVRVVLLLGSQARETDPADEFSDIDVVIGCLDHRRYLEQVDWLADLGRPLLTFVEPTATGGEFERRVLFADGLDVDFSLIAMTRLTSWAKNGMPRDVSPVVRRGMRMIVDKDDVAPRLNAQAEASETALVAPDASSFIEGTHDFLYHCLWAARKAARGELFVALQCLDGPLRRRLFDLIRIDGDLMIKGAPTAWYGARMIETRVDAKTLARLAETCAAHDRRSILAGIDAAMKLHTLLAQDIARRLNITYPREAEARIRSMIAATQGR